MFELIEKSGGQSMVDKLVRPTLCILQVGDVDPRMDGPIPTDVLYVGAPEGRSGVSDVGLVAR